MSYAEKHIAHFVATQKILSVIRKYEITEPVFLPKACIFTQDKNTHFVLQKLSNFRVTPKL